MTLFRRWLAALDRFDWWCLGVVGVAFGYFALVWWWRP